MTLRVSDYICVVTITNDMTTLISTSNNSVTKQTIHKLIFNQLENDKDVASIQVKPITHNQLYCPASSLNTKYAANN